MKIIGTFSFSFFVLQIAVRSQFNCTNDFVPNFEELCSSSETHGLIIHDNLNDRTVLSFGEIKRVLRMNKDGLSVDIYPYNPFTRMEEYLFSVIIKCTGVDYCLSIDSLMSEPNYFTNYLPNEITSQNADSLGYYFSYKLLQTGDPAWLWKIQKCIKNLDASGSFFLLLDIFQCLHILSYRNYSELYLGEAAFDRVYCVTRGKK